MTTMIDRTLDFDRCYRALAARDARFDGWFVVAVSSTGIYCRPSCPAIVPRPDNVRFLRSAAAAQRGGFRACKRCRPDASPGSPEWNHRSDVVGRTMRLIADGVVDREGVDGLGRRLGYSRRQLQRQLTAELGAGPLALARAQRAQTARQLIESTALPFAQIAAAAGFGSARQFNATVQEVYACTPTELRRRVRHQESVPDGVMTVHLPARAPFDAHQVLRFLGARAVPGVEAADGDSFVRSLRLPHGDGVVTLRAAADGLRCQLRLNDLRDLGPAIQRCRRLGDLDADPVAIAGALAEDPVVGRLVAAAPGLRVAGTVDGAELAVRAVLGQQVTVAAARRLTATLVAAAGTRLSIDGAPVTSGFPQPAAIVDAAGRLPMPARRRETVRALAAALHRGDVALDAGCDSREAVRSLLAIPGIGPWTAGYVAMRALGDPDALVTGDAVVRRALHRHGHQTPASRDAITAAWRPWRAYAVNHLWLEAARQPSANAVRGAGR